MKPISKEAVRVVKNQETGEITTFINIEEIGAEIDLDQFIAALADKYGNPALTMTVAGHKKALIAAKEAVIMDMKQATAAVAAINIPK